MGLLDYYRQFEGLSEEEVNSQLREQARERKRAELARVQTLDLSQTTWPDLPHPAVVNAITFVARSGLQRYPLARAAELRSELAHRHGVEPTRIALGNGVAALLESATAALLRPGQELLLPWPSYPLYPLLAARADASAVPVRHRAAGGPRAEALLAAVSERTRLLAIASPNDPTGELFAADELERLLSALPEQVAVLLDEALVDYAGAERARASLRLLERHPRLIVFRSFSKAWGLAGLRIGYALGGPGAEELLGRLEPDLGISDIAQVAALESLRSAAGAVAARVQMVARERLRLTDALRLRGFEATDSAANFLWVSHPRIAADELTDRFARLGVLVASGAALGEPAHVRIAVQHPSATERILEALATVI